MSFELGTLADVYVNGYDLTAWLRKFDLGATVEEQDATTFGQTQKVYKLGLRDNTFSLEGLFDSRGEVGGTADAIDDILEPALSQVDVVWAFLPQGDGFGQNGYGMLGTQTKYEVTTPVEGLGQVSAESRGSKRERVTSLHALANEAATGTGNDHDDGATGMPTTNGAVGYLQAIDLSAAGGDTLDVTIQHSTDGVAWVDLVTFTQVVADHAAERIEVAGTVNRHVRAIWTLSAGASATFHVAFARL